MSTTKSESRHIRAQCPILTPPHFDLILRQPSPPGFLKMDVECSGIPLATFLLFLLLSAIFPPPFSAANQFLHNKTLSPPISFHSLVSSTVFKLEGSIYPNGGYTVSLDIGDPPKAFDLAIDTGSDLTWVQCDKQCTGCTLPRDKLYKPHNNFVKCADPVCVALEETPSHPCPNPSADCEYWIHYADQTSSEGVLVRDYIPLKGTDHTIVRPVPQVAFGCANNLKYSGPSPRPVPPGVLGLGNGKTSILSQLRSLGVIRNVVGHCLSGKGGKGGYLFFGDKFIPSFRIVWTPTRKQSSPEIHYMTGPADLLFSTNPTPAAKGLCLTFDSGSTFTYLNSESYGAVVELVNNNLKGKPVIKADISETLKNCWKAKPPAKPWKSLRDVHHYFEPLTLSFTTSGKSQFRLPPEAYLVMEKKGGVCMGIINGTQKGLGNRNVLGAISLQYKIVIYDNENQRIGWGPAYCDDHPKL